MSFLCWGLQSWTHYSRRGLTRVEWRGRITSFNMLITLLLMQYRIKLAFWAMGANWWMMLSFSSTSTPKSFSSAGLLSIHSLPSLYLCSGLPKPMCRPCTWPCWTSWGLHRPTSPACQGPTRWQPFPPVCWPHHTDWCCRKTCWGCTQSHCPCCRQRH